MNRKKYIIMLLGVLLMGGITGCMSTPYLAKRTHDFKDMATFTLGTGAGIKLRGGPLHLGLLKNEEWGGLRGGEFFTNKAGVNDYEEFEYFVWTANSFSHGQFREKSFDFLPFDIPLFGKEHAVNTSGMFPFVSLPDTRFSDPKNGVPLSYYSECELVLGLGGSLRLGLNPGEMLDWFLGCFGLDIFQDDYLTMQEYVNCGLITPEDVKENAERIKGRIAPSDDLNKALLIAVSRCETDNSASNRKLVEILLDLGANPDFPGVMKKARIFLKDTSTLKRMEKLAGEK